MKYNSPLEAMPNGAEHATKILRNVVIQVQPRTLGRPGRAVDTLRQAPSTATPDACREPVSIDQLLLEARQAAYAAGYAAATQESEGKALDECGRIQAAARETGYREGSAKGMEDAKADAGAVLQRSEAALEAEWHKKFEYLEHMLQEGSGQITARVDEAEEEMIALVYESVGAILGEALATQQGIRAMVHHLVVQRRNRAQLAVHLHPQDWAMVSKNLGIEPATAPAVQWVSDPKVTLGGVVLHHAQGRLDAALDTVMRNLQETLLRVHESRHQAVAVAVAPSMNKKSAA